MIYRLLHAFVRSAYSYTGSRPTHVAHVAEILCTTRCNRVLTRSSADADNGFDAFNGQSRSTNIWYHFGSIATFR